MMTWLHHDAIISRARSSLLLAWRNSETPRARAGENFLKRRGGAPAGEQVLSKGLVSVRRQPFAAGGEEIEYTIAYVRRKRRWADRCGLQFVVGGGAWGNREHAATHRFGGGWRPRWARATCRRNGWPRKGCVLCLLLSQHSGCWSSCAAAEEEHWAHTIL